MLLVFLSYSWKAAANYTRTSTRTLCDIKALNVKLSPSSHLPPLEAFARGRSEQFHIYKDSIYDTLFEWLAFVSLSVTVAVGVAR